MYPIVKDVQTYLADPKKILLVAEEENGRYTAWFKVRYAPWMFEEERENFTDEDREHPFCYTNAENESLIKQFIQDEEHGKYIIINRPISQ